MQKASVARRVLSLRTWVLLLFLLGLSAFPWESLAHRGTREKSSLEESGLPPDLPGQQRIRVLELPEDVSLGNWLPKGLRVLTAPQAIADSDVDWPSSLHRLNISGASISRPDNLPESLRVLDVSWTQLGDSDLNTLPQQLESLSLAGESIQNLSLLPRSLATLSLDQTGSDLRGIPTGLRRLRLMGTGFNTLDGLPPSLISLSLTATSVTTIDALPTSLRALELIGNDALRLDRLPPFLTELTLAGPPPSLTSLRYLENLDATRVVNLDVHGFTSLPDTISTLRLNTEDFLKSDEEPEELKKRVILHQLPLSIRKLTLLGGSLLDFTDLPPNVTNLSLNWYANTSPPRLPNSVTCLDLSWSAITLLTGIPRGIEELDVSATGLLDVSELTLLQRLKVLRLRWSKVAILPVLPKSLAVLDLRGSSHIRNLPALPPNLQELDLSQTGISHLPRGIDSVRSLDISNTKIRELRGLPRHLQALTISRGQLQNLSGMPSSVYVLHIVEKSGPI